MLCLVYLEVMSILSLPMEAEEVDLAQEAAAHLVQVAAAHLFLVAVEHYP